MWQKMFDKLSGDQHLLSKSAAIGKRRRMRVGVLCLLAVLATDLSYFSIEIAAAASGKDVKASAKKSTANNAKSEPKKDQKNDTAPKREKTKTAESSDTQLKNEAETKDDTQEKAEKQSESKSQSGLKGALGGAQSKDAPLYIKSDALHIDSKGRKFTYDGNVEVKRDDLTITSNVMDGYYDESNKIDNVVCKGNVVITRGDTLRATANKAIYLVQDGTIELTEGPELFHNGNALAADKVTIYVNEDRSEAEGNVRVKVIKTDQSQAQ